jgi:hypothetical protein
VGRKKKTLEVEELATPVTFEQFIATLPTWESAMLQDNKPINDNAKLSEMIENVHG